MSDEKQRLIRRLTRRLDFDPESYLAGILDATGRVEIKRSPGGQWSWKFYLLCDPWVADTFADMASIRLKKGRAREWHVQAKDVVPLLERMLTRIKVLHPDASRLYRYAITRASTRGLRGSLKKAVDDYRRRLVETLKERG